MSGKLRVLSITTVLLLMLALFGGHQSNREETTVNPAPAASEAEAADPSDPGSAAEPEPEARQPESAVPSEPEPEAEPEPVLSPEELAALEAAETDARLRERVRGLTLEEKVGQLFFVQCPAADAAEEVAQYHPGGVLLFTRDYQDPSGNWLTEDAFKEKLAGLQSAAREDTGIPLFIGSDEEGGTVTRASRNLNLFSHRFRPPRQVWAESGGEEEAVARDARERSAALLALGINVNLAPVCDVSTNPADFIYDRTLGEDATATAAFVRITVEAMGEAGIGAVLKHFPGYGSNADTHTGIAVDNRPYEAFETADFLPFAAGIEAGAPFVLVSHNIVNCMDEQYPSSLSPAVHRVLREELGFEGVVLTDDLSMEAVAAYAGDGSVAELALLAGNDMLITADYKTQIPLVVEAVRSGALDEERIDAACLRVLRAKLALGLLEE